MSMERNARLWHVTQMIVRTAPRDAGISIELAARSSHVMFSWPTRQTVITTLVGNDGHVTIVRESFDFAPKHEGRMRRD